MILAKTTKNGRRLSAKVKKQYEEIRIKVILIESVDIVTASTLSNDGGKNYDDGGWA